MTGRSILPGLNLGKQLLVHRRLGSETAVRQAVHVVELKVRVALY